MARSNIPMVINLRQNTNDDSTAFGKYFSDVCTCARTGRRVHERAARTGTAREARRTRHVLTERRWPEAGQE